MITLYTYNDLKSKESKKAAQKHIDELSYYYDFVPGHITDYPKWIEKYENERAWRVVFDEQGNLYKLYNYKEII